MSTVAKTSATPMLKLETAVDQAIALIHVLTDRCAQLETLNKPYNGAIGAGLSAIAFRTTDDLLLAFDAVETLARNPERS